MAPPSAKAKKTTNAAATTTTGTRRPGTAEQQRAEDHIISGFRGTEVLTNKGLCDQFHRLCKWIMSNPQCLQGSNVFNPIQNLILDVCYYPDKYLFTFNVPPQDDPPTHATMNNNTNNNNSPTPPAAMMMAAMPPPTMFGPAAAAFSHVNVNVAAFGGEGQQQQQWQHVSNVDDDGQEQQQQQTRQLQLQIHEDVKSLYEERLQKAIETVRKEHEEWIERLADWIEWKNTKGNIEPPIKCVEMPEMGLWACEQRAEKRIMDDENNGINDSGGYGDVAGFNATTTSSTDKKKAVKAKTTKTKLTPARFKVLDRLNFPWTKDRHEVWNQRYNELVEFKKKHGHTRCTRKRHWKDHRELAIWVEKQRRMKAAKDKGKWSSLTPYRIQKLDEIGFHWFKYTRKERPWKEYYQELVEYKKQFGTCQVRSAHDEKLAAWVAAQKSRRKLNRLPQENIQLLDEIGFTWEQKHPIPFDVQYKKLVRYKEEHGHCNVPAEWKEDIPLSRFVQKMRQWRKGTTGRDAGTLPQEYIDRLDAIGFKWRLMKPFVRGPKKRKADAITNGDEGQAVAATATTTTAAAAVAALPPSHVQTEHHTDENHARHHPHPQHHHYPPHHHHQQQYHQQRYQEEEEKVSGGHDDSTEDEEYDDEEYDSANSNNGGGQVHDRQYEDEYRRSLHDFSL